MATGCVKVTKYFLFLFNLLFFILGALILGFGIWILVDSTSFIAVLQSASESLKIGSYILISVGAVTMVMGFLGCLGAVNEIRCLLGVYFACLLLILVAQIAAGVLIYYQKDKLKTELTTVIEDLIQNYDYQDGMNTTTEKTWDYVQRQLKCCGWTNVSDWDKNPIIKNSSGAMYPCSCNSSSPDLNGFCMTPLNSTTVEFPSKGCMEGVESWLKDNLGIILGICAGVAVIEFFGMILSICLCRNIHSEDYTKVPKY
uniref:Tetraspanin n=1 Tax=Geotrypetes seraphini TaxID=260995 RepID=A0A6P8PJV7_GEOSA|nr:CD82 antigen [Geotrypetes seraphini]XP_033784185.1 CD82 antigen [Geotrypetes seraphini]